MSARVRVLLRPTGRPGEGLALGQARTALYGWLYARHEGGTLLLRVAEGGSEAPLDDLRWLGLDWDEGPFFESSAHGDALRARVSDDHQLGVTHVLLEHGERSQAGQERALYRAMGREPPEYLHLPPIRQKTLREPVRVRPLVGGVLAVQKDVSAEESLNAYRARGYLPLALANCLARLGWTPRGKRELLPLPELAARFDPQRVSHSPASFDLAQLDWFGRRALCALDGAELAALLVPRWQEAFGGADRAAGTALSPVQWQQALALALRNELDYLDQAVERARFAFVDEIELDEPARGVLAQPYACEVLAAFLRELPAVEPFSYDEIDAWIAALRQRFKAALGPAQGVRSRDVMYVLRAALTGRVDGPCLVEICQLLGRERCIERAQRAVCQAP